MRAGVIAGAMALVAPALAAKEFSPGALKRVVERALDRPAFAAAYWAVEVRSLTSGRVLYERNARKNMTPASTLKLVTTAAALDAFGSDATVRTTLESAGRLDALGRLLGDVYLVGRGDPLLARPGADGRTGFDVLADALRDAGVKRIEGRLVGHEGLFKNRRGEDWEWADLVWCYGAEVSALAWRDNCAALKVGAGEQVGDPVVVDREPESRYYAVVSTATTSPAGSASDLRLERDLGSNLVRLSGTHPLGAEPEKLEVALEDPARYAATAFVEALETRGIRVALGAASALDALPPGARVLAGCDSPPLAEIVKEINKSSQNLYTEMLLRLLGARVKGEGSVAAGREAVADFLKAHRIGEGASLQDGSGLSRTDLVTPHDLVDLLVAMDRHALSAAFRDSLPVAGVDGTLERRLKGTAAEGRAFAKTGTLRQSNALAGYVHAKSGARFAFSIVVNHHTAPSRDAVEAIDAVVEALARY
ncbi:MAG TPA: D-alanyl-D-alanine carboxypeptidase/D-alanyl-D-alanine-endopeptidase [Vicinamibacteria bacterium]|nr:D-alanyl-D-alanine carboxypeptidase/D-alanyl-D-alanine-endopeptidase [Vicinamibacteria bacterium]